MISITGLGSALVVTVILLLNWPMAAALYVAALINDEKKTQREVADVAGITEVTIRNRYKELIERLQLEEKLKAKVLAASEKIIK